MRQLHIFFLLVIILAGCSDKVEVSRCVPTPITLAPARSDFKKFTVLGPEINGEVHSVFVQDSYAYVGVGDSLVIFDVHDPSRPVQRGVYPGGTTPAKIVGNYAYTYWGEKVHILDISNPDNPVEVECPENGNLDVRRAEFSGGYAYLPAGENGLLIYDATELASPVEVARFQSSTPPDLVWPTSPGDLLPHPVYIPLRPMLALDVALDGDYAYVGEGLLGIDSLSSGRLTILDVSDPSKPDPVGAYTMPRNTAAWQILLDGSYAYVSTNSMYEAQLTVVLDLSDPEHPVGVASFPTGRLLAIYNGFAYFHDEYGLVVWDVSDPTSTELVGTIELPSVYSPVYAGPAVYISDIAFESNFAYVAMEYGGLHILDISDPTHAKEVSIIQYPILPIADFLAVSDNAAYLGRAYGNIEMVDMSEPETLPVLGQIEELGAVDAAVSNGLAYIARGEDGFSVVDVGDLENPSVISSFDTDNFKASRIAAQDDLIFVLDEGVGMHIFDANDLANLTLVSTINLDVTSYDVDDLAVWKEHVYVALGKNEGELVVIDVSDPTRPRIAGNLTSPDFFTSIAADDDFVYVVTSWNLITVIDAKNPEAPFVVSVHDSENFIEDIHSEDGELYLALRYRGGIAAVEFEIP